MGQDLSGVSSKISDQDSEKLWHKSYQAGVPREIQYGDLNSVGDLLESSAKEFSDHVAYYSMGAKLTYSEFEVVSRNFAAFLQKDLKLSVGERVAIMLPNLLQFPIGLFGILRAGCVAVPCNPLYTARELEHQLQDSGASTIIILEDFAHILAATKSQIKNVILAKVGDCLGFAKGGAIDFYRKFIKREVPSYNFSVDNLAFKTLSFRKALSLGASIHFSPVQLTLRDPALLQYTGGTTGVAKGAILSHGNILANALQFEAWVSPLFVKGQEIAITALPLYHIFALGANCFALIKYGVASVLIANPKDIPSLVKEMSKYPFSFFSGVSTLFASLLNDEQFTKLDFRHLKVTLGGGMAVQRVVAGRWKNVTGHVIIEAYGLTECSPAVTVNPLNLPNFAGTIGLPLPSTDVILIDDNGKEVPFFSIGELCVKGPQVMQGYYNKSEETEKVFTPDGYLKTGDLAVMDPDGFFRLVDRKKEIILVSGFNVYPSEVEEVASSHPGVREVAAVGVRNEKSGESVKLFVVKKDTRLTEEELIAHCRKGLTGYKVPTAVEFRTSLPKSNVGKILRRVLKG